MESFVPINSANSSNTISPSENKSSRFVNYLKLSKYGWLMMTIVFIQPENAFKLLAGEGLWDIYLWYKMLWIYKLIYAFIAGAIFTQIIRRSNIKYKLLAGLLFYIAATCIYIISLLPIMIIFSTIMFAIKAR